MGALVIELEKKKKPGGYLGGGDDDKGDEDSESVAAEELWDAVKSDDKAAFTKALDAYVSMCVDKHMVDKEG